MDRIERHPPRQRRAFSNVGGRVDSAGEPTYARQMAELWRVDPAHVRALTHGFHSYAGRMHPSMARRAIERFTSAGDRVVDPFCGSGTVLVEALGLGREAVGSDASPLAVLIAGVRSTPLGEEGRSQLVESARQIAEAAAERAQKRQRPEIPSWAERERERFHAHVALELFGLRELVMGSEEDDVGRALRACFSSILVKFMRAGPQAPRDAETKRIGRGVPSRFFARRAEELARGLATLEARIPPGTKPVSCRVGDAREVRGVKDASTSLVLTSPPYAGTYDYAEHHDVRFLWLGMKRDRFDRAQLGGRDRGLGASPREWHTGRRRWLSEMGRVLTRGGHAILVVGDGVVGDRAEDAAEEVAADAPSAGLTFVARASQERPIQDRRLRDIFGSLPRREHVVLLRK